MLSPYSFLVLEEPVVAKETTWRDRLMGRPSVRLPQRGMTRLFSTTAVDTASHSQLTVPEL